MRPVFRVRARLTGLVDFNSEIVQDDIDRQQGLLLLTPALSRELLRAGTGSGISWFGLQLDHGAAMPEKIFLAHLRSNENRSAPLLMQVLLRQKKSVLIWQELTWPRVEFNAP